MITGAMIVERYRVVQRLGAGATGEVFLVDNLAAGRREAIKIFTDNKDPEVEGRFKREIRATQRLSHQNIVGIHDYGRLPDGRMYLTMEAVDGPSLDELLQQRGPLAIPVALGIAAEVADALHHAHEHGVVHRDIKPTNLIFSPHAMGSLVKVLDFGLAKIVASDAHESVILSRTGAAFGTPAYMSPEQWRAKPPTPSMDIYSLGCVVYELLVGEPPFRAKGVDMVAAHLAEAPRAPGARDPSAGISPAVDALVLRCLAKDANERFATGADLCAAIQSTAEYRPLRSPPPS
jgi:serine/threonine-protein kinase